MGNISVTLNPVGYVLPDTNGEDVYGPFKTIEEANAMKGQLGNRVAAEAKPLGILRTTNLANRGRKPNAEKAESQTATPQTGTGNSKPDSAPGPRVTAKAGS